MNTKKVLIGDEVSEATLRDVMDFFNLGQFDRYVRLSNGRTHATYLVSRETGGEWVVRILGHVNKLLLENQDIIQKQLTVGGVSTNGMLRNEQGVYLYERGNISATVSRKLAGNHPTGTLEECGAIGRALAQFHQAVKSIPYSNDRMLLCNQRIDTFLYELPDDVDKRVVEHLLSQITSDTLDQLPAGIIHGDLHRFNVLLNDQKVSILDMDSSGQSVLLLDIGRSIADICRVGDGLDASRVEEYVRGYAQIRKLTDLESRVLPQAIALAAGAVALWFYNHNDYAFADDFIRVGSDALRLKSSLLV